MNKLKTAIEGKKILKKQHWYLIESSSIYHKVLFIEQTSI